MQRYTPEDLEKLSNVIGTVFLIDQHTYLRLDELVELFKKLAPTIDKLQEQQREQFAIWLEQILRRLAKTKEKEKEIKQIVLEIQKKGMSAVLSNLEKNLEWIEQQGILKGMEKGMEKGLEKGLETVALNLLQEGMDISFIAKVTGLPEERIQGLKRRIN